MWTTSYLLSSGSIGWMELSATRVKLAHTNELTYCATLPIRDEDQDERNCPHFSSYTSYHQVSDLPSFGRSRLRLIVIARMVKNAVDNLLPG